MLGMIRASSPGGENRREFLWPVDVLALLLLTWIGGNQKNCFILMTLFLIRRKLHPEAEG